MKKMAMLGLGFFALWLAPLCSHAAVQTYARTGTLASLRIQEISEPFGPPGDTIDVEVIVALNTSGTENYGFQLRVDQTQVMRRAMLDLLRDAYKNDWTVTLVYQKDPAKNNGILIRVQISK